MNLIRGYIQSRIVYLLMNLNITPRHIYFSRHGESVNNVLGKIGGDANLSPAGWTHDTLFLLILYKYYLGWTYSELLPSKFDSISYDSLKIPVTGCSKVNTENTSTSLSNIAMAQMKLVPSDMTHEDSPSSFRLPPTPTTEREKVTVWVRYSF